VAQSNVHIPNSKVTILLSLKHVSSIIIEATLRHGK
jgi:hypothetical protein